MNQKNLLMVILVIFLFSISLVAAHMGESHSEMMYGAYGGTGMIFGWILYLLVIALIVAAIYWLIKSASSRDRRR